MDVLVRKSMASWPVVRDEEVVGSNPAIPTKPSNTRTSDAQVEWSGRLSLVGELGRALYLGPVGH
jgi:hypothetical protein